MSKRAIVTGVPGQDASYLCEFLLDMDYEVIGISRRSTRENSNMDGVVGDALYTQLTMDVTDTGGIANIINEYQPDEFYNLSAQSHVGQSFAEPVSTLQIDGMAVAGMLESIRRFSPRTRFYQASTSEMFGNNGSLRWNEKVKAFALTQTEFTQFSPRSPYAAAKVYAHEMVGIYRKAYDLHASAGILMNHESPRRGLEFVTRKITYNMARIVHGQQKKIRLGNLQPHRDFGYAADYVRAMWLMLQQREPDDYVIATGHPVSVREVLQYVLDLSQLNRPLIEVYEKDKKYMRPCEVMYLCGDATKASAKLSWRPTVTWKELLKMMFDHDCELVRQQVLRNS